MVVYEYIYFLTAVDDLLFGSIRIMVVYIINSMHNFGIKYY